MAGEALDSVVSHWSTLIENFQVSPLAFYQAVEAALTRRDIPETKQGRTDYREGGVMSAKREYVRVTRYKLNFDVCGAPFGTGFFVSWWLTEDVPYLNPAIKAAILIGMLIVVGFLWTQLGIVLGTVIPVVAIFLGLTFAGPAAADGTYDDSFLMILPVVGPLYVRFFKQVTFYRIDTMEMFQKAVHNAVLEVIDAMTEGKGIRALSETDRKPIMREFYTRKGA